MSKLTKRQALEATAEMWGKLAKTGKPKQPGSGFIYGCACCQYVFDRMPELNIDGDGVPPMPCSNTGLLDSPTGLAALRLCPLKELWPKGCESIGSPYTEWRYTPIGRERKLWAGVIAAGAKAALAKLPKRKAAK